MRRVAVELVHISVRCLPNVPPPVVARIRTDFIGSVTAEVAEHIYALVRQRFLCRNPAHPRPSTSQSACAVPERFAAQDAAWKLLTVLSGYLQPLLLHCIMRYGIRIPYCRSDSHCSDCLVDLPEVACALLCVFPLREITATGRVSACRPSGDLDGERSYSFPPLGFPLPGLVAVVHNDELDPGDFGPGQKPVP
jgi:hypothetical protein